MCEMSQKSAGLASISDTIVAGHNTSDVPPRRNLKRAKNFRRDLSAQLFFSLAKKRTP
jgi:hypothetical protein